MEFSDRPFMDNDLRDVLNRALRSVIIALLIGIPITWFAWIRLAREVRLAPWGRFCSGFLSVSQPRRDCFMLA